MGDIFLFSVSRLLNVVLRFGALSVRFLFIFFLARYLEPDSLGYYGIFSATIAYGMIFVGFEFFVYVTRDLINSAEEDRGRMLKGHAVLSGILYILLLPATAAFLQKVGWPSHLYLWFMPILILEHLNQEIYRLLVTMSEQIAASALLFLRQASWAIAVIILMAIFEAGLTLDTIMLYWLIAGLFSAILGFWKVRQIEIGGWCRPIDWMWVRNGLLVAAPFLSATLAQRGIFTFDRYWLEAIGGPDVVGAYVLFFGMASALTVLLDAAVISFIYPELIKHHHASEHLIARAKVRSMLYQTLAMSAAFALISWIALPFLLAWIDKPIYQDFVGLYPGVLMAIVLLALSQVPHWGLYSRGKDRVIVLSNLLALAAFLVCTWAASDRYGIYAVLVGMNAAFSLALILKSGAYIRLNLTEYASTGSHSR